MCSGSIRKQKTENRKLRLLLPDAGNLSAAVAAVAVFHGDLNDVIPPPGDDHFAAGVAESAFRVVPRQVADIDVFQPGLQRDLVGFGQGTGRGGVDIEHLVHGVEAGELQGGEGAQVFPDPAAHGGDFLGAVVVLGDDEVDDLHMHAPAPQDFQGFKHRFQFPVHQVTVKLLVKGF
jgi:hypothetical protein